MRVKSARSIRKGATANTLRRLLESLGLERRAKDVRLIEHDRDEQFRQEILQVLREDDNEQEEARP
jgi:hypothetical protein